MSDSLAYSLIQACITRGQPWSLGHPVSWPALAPRAEPPMPPWPSPPRPYCGLISEGDRVGCYDAGRDGFWVHAMKARSGSTMAYRRANREHAAASAEN